MTGTRSFDRPYEKWVINLVRVALAVVALFLILFGAILISKGGSPYYLIYGLSLIAAALVLRRHTAIGMYITLVGAIGTVVWAYTESGLNKWYLFPRIFVPLCIVFVTILIVLWRPDRTKWALSRSQHIGLASVVFLCIVGIFGSLFVASSLQGAINPTSAIADGIAPADWTQFAGGVQRTGYVPFSQINKENVKRLKVAWTYRTGDAATNGAEDQNTPIQVNGTVYTCSPRNIISALDADTGQQKWKFDSHAQSPIWQRCRTLAYVDTQKDTLRQVAQADDGQCVHRIVMGTADNRLIALDAETGTPCSDFGDNGTVNLKEGMGQIDPGYYMQTSGPTIIENGLIVIAGWVTDNMSVGEPSGVVRAFDALDGSLVWAWDLGNPKIDKLPPPGETYTRGTPNVWAFPAVDEKLGLVYLPTGNATPDYWGGSRSEDSEKYSSSVVALDYRTGKERWHFQTTHHDIWDYDVPVHPTLYDIPGVNGADSIPALIQLTKRGEIFVLDRRTGKPVFDVEERPVPTQGAADGEKPLSATQPYSVGMPQIRSPELSEKAMWGMTMFDQLLCRIQFRKYRYEGDFTPQSAQGTIQYPSNAGGMNWGGGAIDKEHNYLIVNDTRVAQLTRLIPRAEASDDKSGDGHSGYEPQLGTPFGVNGEIFSSPLGVPCNAPPLGTLTAIDLSTQKVAWQVPLGTPSDAGPVGMKTHLPMKVGMPSLGGPLTTGGGLIFYSGTLDYYLRAFDSRTGELLWKSALPVGGQATPMSYVSASTKKQYIVLTASGSRYAPDRGDYVIAYTLEDDQAR